MHSKIAIAIAALLPALALATPFPSGSVSCVAGPNPADCAAAIDNVKTINTVTVGDVLTSGTCAVSVLAGTDITSMDLATFQAMAKTAYTSILACGRQEGTYAFQQANALKFGCGSSQSYDRD